MILLVGLGNPGGKYAKNRHNIGFMAVDEIVRRHSFSPWRTKFQGQLCEGQIGSEKVLVLKPETYMNESGRSVGAAVRFYKLNPSDVVVFHDELDLPPNRLKVKVGGGHGGHNGLRSIDDHLGKDYRRVRLGIGHPGHKDRVTGYVLGDFAKSEEPALEDFLALIEKHIALILRGDDAGFMNRISSGMRPEKTVKAKPAQNSAPATENPVSVGNEGAPSSAFDKLRQLLKKDE